MPYARRTMLGAGVAVMAAGPAALAQEAIAGRLERLTAPGGRDNRATYTPSGKDILFASQRSGTSQIWTMRAEGSGARRLLVSAANDHGRVAPSVDGRHLCFSSDRNGENAIFVLDTVSERVTRISDLAWWSFGPCWSSRGLIAYFSRKGGNQINIWTCRQDGSEARQITDRPGESRQPWWSPDGSALALSADGGSGAFQVWVSAPDGSAARRITPGTGDWQQPFWSPDGSRMAVSAKVAGSAHFRILVLGRGGEEPRPIGQPENTDNVHPAWAPDGRSIVFTSGQGDGAALWAFSFA